MMNLADLACADVDEARAIAAAYELPIAQTLADHLDACPRCSKFDGPPAGTSTPPELVALAGHPSWREEELRAAMLLASHANPQYQVAVLSLLAERATVAQPAEAWAAFARMLLDVRDAEVAIAAVDALAALVPAEGAAEGLEEALVVPSTHVRAAAARAIAADATVAARPAVLASLGAALRDTEKTDARTRWLAAAALGAAGPAAATYQSALIGALADDPSWLVRRSAAFALGNAGLAGQVGIKEALRRAADTDEDEDVKQAAAAVLEPEKPSRTITSLKQTALGVIEALRQGMDKLPGLQPQGAVFQMADERQLIASYRGDQPGGPEAHIYLHSRDRVLTLLLDAGSLDEPDEAADIAYRWEVSFPKATGREEDGIRWLDDREPAGFQIALAPGWTTWEGRVGWLLDDRSETLDAAKQALADIDAELTEGLGDEASGI